MNRRIAATAALAAVALALTGCSGDGAQGGAVTTPEELRIGNFADLTSWDPALADIGFNAPYLSAVYDPLVAIDGDGQPQPALATDWETSADHLTITMNLRDDAVFADGEPFDAAAAVANLEYLKGGAISRESYLNAESFTAVDDDTIEIHLSERDDRLLYFMGLGRSYMASPAAIEAGTLADAPVGSGPYTLSDATVPGAEYVFDKVDDHWAADEFPFAHVKVMPMQDPNARNNALEAGQIDVSYGDATTVQMAEQHDWNVASQVASWVGLRINDHTGSQLAPLGDERVRQALAYAFDGATMLATIGEGQGEDTNQLFAYGFRATTPSSTGSTPTTPSRRSSCSPRPGTPTASTSPCRWPRRSRPGSPPSSRPSARSACGCRGTSSSTSTTSPTRRATRCSSRCSRSTPTRRRPSRDS